MDIPTFKRLVWGHYKKHGRHDLPWRQKSHLKPYNILVSEVMLQQTQVDRVIPKYRAFTKRFPNFKQLAHARQKDVLKLWSGLGYNRRALYLYRIAKIVHDDFGGILPRDQKELVKLPGIGPYTASAIRVFAYNIPDVMIETNIRSVFIKHCAELRGTNADMRRKISDEELAQYIAQTLDRKNPRLWYAALMDYGAHLKKTIGNQNARSKHYTKQSPFEGSNRQLRGAVLRETLKKPATTEALAKKLKFPKGKALPVLKQLAQEGLLSRRHGGAWAPAT